METYSEYLCHHGISGMKWGQRNGPPYPLVDGQRSAKENKLNKTSQSAKDKGNKMPDSAKKKSKDNVNSKKLKSKPKVQIKIGVGPSEELKETAKQAINEVKDSAVSTMNSVKSFFSKILTDSGERSEEANIQTSKVTDSELNEAVNGFKNSTVGQYYKDSPNHPNFRENVNEYVDGYLKEKIQNGDMEKMKKADYEAKKEEMVNKIVGKFATEKYTSDNFMKKDLWEENEKNWWEDDDK